MIEARTFWELVERRALETPEALFGLDESLKSMTFGEYRDAAERVAAGLFAQGIGAGSLVSWILPTCFDSLVLTAALARLGAVQIPILPIYRGREVGFCLKQTGAELVIIPRVYRGFDYAEMLAKLAQTDTMPPTLVVDGDLPQGDPADLPPAPAPDSDDDVRWIFYTSGTTGDAKGAKHTDRSILQSSLGMAHAMDMGPSDRIALVFPVTHLGGANSLTAALYSGAGHLVVDQFFQPGVIDFLAEYGVTHAGAGTVFHQTYLAEQRKAGSASIFPTIRAFQGGGAPKPPQLHYDLKREIGGAGILSVYGMTECPIISLGRLGDPDEQLAHCEGRVNTPGTEYRLVEVEGEEDTVQTELWIRAPQLFKGYVDESLDKEVFADFDGQRFYQTGDLASVDDKGNLTIEGRLKDVIIRRGENIASLEVELLLAQHPKVAEVAVIGLPTETGGRGELVCAAVVTVPDSEPLAFDEMKAFLKDRGLMNQKIPEQLEFVTGLPKNPTMKVLKRKLKQQFAACL
jgi:cyclohexanecarboxylate-CoA ligase